MVVEVLAGAVASVVLGDTSALSQTLFRDRRFRERVVDGLLESDLDLGQLDRPALGVLLRDDEFWAYVADPSSVGDEGPGSGLEHRLLAAGLESDSDSLEAVRGALQRAVVVAVLEQGSVEQKFLVIQAVEHTEALHYLLALVLDVRDQLTGHRSATEVTRFGRPPLVADDFRGRGDLLATLGSAGLSVVTAVQGIGGVGKTQLAARFFRDHQAEFDFAVWVDMREQDGLVDLGSVVDELGLSVESTDPATAVANHVKGSDASWLMVFDNAESPAQVESFVVQAPNVTTVVTSRYRSWQRFGSVLRVDVFDHDTAVGFLAERAGRPDDPDAGRVAERLGFLPLALSLAGAYVRERSISFGRYLERDLPAGLTEALSPDDPTSYDRAVDALWAESLGAVAERDVGCRELIEVLSVIDWTQVDRAWLAGRPGFGVNVRDLDRQLGLLASFSLIRLTDITVGIAHNLIAHGIAAQAGSRCGDLVAELFADVLPEASATKAAAETAAEPIRHLQRLLADHPALAGQSLTATILHAANQLNQQGSVVQDFHHLAVGHCEHHHGKHTRFTLQARANLAYSYWQAGRIGEAITIEEQVLADYERLLGGEHRETLRARSNLASSYAGAGRNDEAITMFEQLLADRERLLGGEHPDTLTARSNLAVLYRQAGRIGEAITIREQVLADRERLLGGEHPDTLTARANLASSYAGAGRNDEAITMFEQVLADRERLLGGEHPDTLTARANLATSYRQAGRNDEAITMFEQVLADYERLLGGEHPDTLTARANLATSYRQAGRNDEAITMFEQVLADRERLLGGEHPDTLTARANLATSYRQAGRNHEADALQPADSD